GRGARRNSPTRGPATHPSGVRLAAAGPLSRGARMQSADSGSRSLRGGLRDPDRLSGGDGPPKGSPPSDRAGSGGGRRGGARLGGPPPSAGAGRPGRPGGGPPDA